MQEERNGSVQETLARIRHEIGKVLIGQREVIDQCLVAILTNNHVLIEGVPGVAKTLLVRTLAHVLGCAFNRIQFTPDLMPSDITGTSIFNLQRNEFAVMRGPVFTTFLLADEINRAPAKTQSALLQAMQERAVSIDRETYPLSPNFTVFATQNPVEYEGTYPLPEAQKDRFMLKVIMACPSRAEELELARRMAESDSPEKRLADGVVLPVLDEAALTQLRRNLQGILLRDELLGYIVDIVHATRRHEAVLVGAGPRATQALVQASRAVAALDERDYVTPDDVKLLAGSVLGHRLVLRPEHDMEGVTPSEVVASILQEVPVPR